MYLILSFNCCDIDDGDLEDPNKLLRNNGQISTGVSRTESDVDKSDSLLCCKWLTLASAVDKKYSG